MKLLIFFPRKTSNFFGCPLSVGTFQMPPFTIAINTGTQIELLGIEGSMLKLVANKLNFTIIPLVFDFLWGKVNDNGTSSGVISLVMNETVNFTVGLYPSSYHLKKFMSSSVTYFSTNLVFAFTKNKEFSPIERLAIVFDAATWTAIVVVIVIG